AATGLVFAVVSMGILGRTQENKEPITPASHNHNNMPPLNPETESPPLSDVKIVPSLAKSHHTPSKEEVDALVKAYVEKHGDNTDIDSIRKAVVNYLIKKQDSP
ncbi:MAG: hypothetical protein KAI51_02590, partial [Candidatus Aenigmarchaeota archaeon]|nr:hypothetical protein [Candidatus Aenigmarchaeota archaeon]